MRDFNDSRSSSSRGSDRPGGRSGGRPSGGFGGSRFGGRSSGGFGGSKFGARSGGFGDSSARRFSPRDSGRAEMHDATCADCGNTCQVPFLPTGAKPVYCSSCFEMRGNGEDRGGRPPHRFERPSFQENRSFSAPTSSAKSTAPSAGELEAINAKLDKILKTLAYIAKQQPNNEPAIEVPQVAPAAETPVAEKPKAEKKVRTAKKAGITIMPLAPTETSSEASAA